MSTLPVSALTRSIVELLTEAYAVTTDGNRTTWFNDNSPDAGIFGQINPLSAAEASASADGTGNPGTTVAAHVEHLRWSLANVNRTIRGEPWNPNWGDSWKVTRVDDVAWNTLRQELQREFDDVCVAIQKQEELEGAFLNGLIALVPHAAYHLATIRQIIERVRIDWKTKGS